MKYPEYINVMVTTMKKKPERVLQCREHVRKITVVKEKGTRCQTTVGKILHRKLKIKQSEVKFAEFLFGGFRLLKLNYENVYSATITILDNNWLYFLCMLSECC